ncbi:hypothetical protein PS858_01681 [Pseudomonas fluorescens]|uniref:AAA family ATPase n=1 Tax=Pseudomonas fluorescens TaxID=294 RepID=UPI0012428301|nr:AAA family ATPase [Pseudomonas fluorescens]VVO78474.1 hypothetical protein PS858_01681 [Pseudomonas fluorescens]
MLDLITDKVTRFYLNSNDFNGYPVHALKKDFKLNNTKAKQVLVDLVSSNLIEVVFGNIHPNPHIKAFSGTSVAQQLEFLDTLEFSDHFCLYPVPQTLEGFPALPDFTPTPYTKLLALGAGQLDFRVFDLSVLEHYRNDPRYHYETDFINGNISIRDEYFESSSMPEHDQILLQSFGFAHDKDLNRAVAVFLRYLSDLSPEHQAIWKAKELCDEHQLHPGYLANSMGHWGTKISIFSAFTQEIDLINKMAEIIKKPPLFRKSFINEKPRDFGFLLRPTLAEFNKFVLLLDQMMSDNLNKKFFSPELELEEDNERPDGKIEVRQKGTIALLDEWAHTCFVAEEEEPIKEMMDAFRKVRKLRQSPAHSIKEDAFDQKYFHEQRALMIEAYSAIRMIRLILSNHPSVKLEPPKISDFLYKGKIWTI